ncbi:RES family NAD+ phosphorylase [Oceanihabitans sp. 2_MG-2023]|uniref:RES family NAD+ phosphorylase n=1 Tax=Oceanihabitans sp. 2_MG-2023 TaxID=3062661 RepID=UPI0026E1DFD6|nr:RES family NAD+ phosphorylase [Oceanihabitans sp. 2_MG-2023]MDO6598365.1 RES family NAD+ phosphorylase [Oceanihabitans sp. 2_MG-2023]
MKIYRIAKKQYLKDLSGEGARLYGGRWNKKGYNMVYFSESLSLAVLEILVHIDFKFLTNDFGFLEAQVPDSLISPKLKESKLDTNWRHNPPSNYSMQFGTDWLKTNANLAMQVPSAILPMTNNILVNPTHSLIKEVKIIKTGVLDVDSRVFQKK